MLIRITSIFDFKSFFSSVTVSLSLITFSCLRFTASFSLITFSYLCRISSSTDLTLIAVLSIISSVLGFHPLLSLNKCSHSSNNDSAHLLIALAHCYGPHYMFEPFDILISLSCKLFYHFYTFLIYTCFKIRKNV